MKLYFLIDRTALHLAIEKGHLDIIRDLLAYKGIDVNITTILNFDFFIQFYI